MSADPTLFINGKYVGPITDPDWKAYLAQHYPGCTYELKNGYQVMMKVSVVQAMEIVENRKAVVVGD